MCAATRRIGLQGALRYHSLLDTGWPCLLQVRDGQGRKMSKSIGNVVDPVGVISQYGTDALRFTLATGEDPMRRRPLLSIFRLGASQGIRCTAACVLMSVIIGTAMPRTVSMLCIAGSVWQVLESNHRVISCTSLQGQRLART